MSAEYCYNDYVFHNGTSLYDAESAGTEIKKCNSIDPKTAKRLADHLVYGDKSFATILVEKHHQPQQLTKELIEEFDVVIAMAKSHQEYIRENFNVEVPLFNELAYDDSSSVDDVCDVMDDYKNNMDLFERHLIETVDYIHEAMPNLVKKLSEQFK